MHIIICFLFVLGADEYLKRLEGKIRKCLFFYVKIFSNNSVLSFVYFCFFISVIMAIEVQELISRSSNNGIGTYHCEVLKTKVQELLYLDGFC